MNKHDRKSDMIKVVVNYEGQYSIWPADRENPLGWRDVGKRGTKKECLAYIKDVWSYSLSRHSLSRHRLPLRNGD